MTSDIRVSKSRASRETLMGLLDAQARRDWEAEGRFINRMVREEKGRPSPCSPSTTPLQRLLSKIAFGFGECWYWTGCLHGLGYGMHGRLLGETKAHRLSYVIYHGPIPTGLHVLHTCDVRNCVNPNHLMLGTHTDNMRDMVSKGRWRGHKHCGEANPQAKLTAAQVAYIRLEVAYGIPQGAMARKFGVAPTTISRIVRRKAWV